MAVDAASLTLAQYAQMSNSPIVRSIGYSLLQFGSVLSDIPLVTRRTLVASGVRFVGSNLPAPTWTKLNAEPTVVTATPTPFQEQVYLIRNAIDTDAKLVNEENAIVDPRALRLQAYLEGVTYDLNDKFINNNQVTGNSDCFVGLRARLDDPTTYGCESEMKLTGAAVDMTQGAMTAATANTFIELVGQLLNYMGTPQGDGVVLYMNELLKLRFERAIRMLGAGAGFTTTADAFDRSVERFKNAKIRVIGRKADQTTQIITNTEATTGLDSNSTYTSLYAVRFGDGYFSGWQFDSLDQSVRDLGLLDNGVIYRTVIDWAIGLFQAHTRAVGRIYDIKVA
jgi:hypothetical protein